MKLPHSPYLLLIFDGWGYSEQTENNAIAQAYTPNWDAIWQQYPHTLISGSGADVGLPDGQMGNSEVGHLNMGAGRMVPQDLGRIHMEIKNGAFYKNPLLIDALQTVVLQQKAVHILGLLSDGGVHSHEDHIFAMVELAAQQGAKNIYVHAFLDGRDTAPKSALQSLEKLNQKLSTLGCGQVASICGRYFAMDRDKRWDRVALAYELLTEGKADYSAPTAETGLMLAYARDETDEFVKPTTIYAENTHPIKIADGDGVFFMNFRADRARQLSYALTDLNFSGFVRKQFPQLGTFVTLTEYAKDIKAVVAYSSLVLNNILGEYLANKGLRQLRIAETEKYAHVTFFFNGGIEAPFENEERILISSPKVATYDLQPEMSAPELTEKLVTAIKSKKYDLIICNYANADMVGHSGKLPAAIKAVEAIDKALGQILKALKEVNGEMLITADHGNVEDMLDPTTMQAHTAHTSNPVPLVYIGSRNLIFKETHGTLCDVAPTLLHLMDLEQPIEMTGNNLFK